MQPRRRCGGSRRDIAIPPPHFRIAPIPRCCIADDIRYALENIPNAPIDSLVSAAPPDNLAASDGILSSKLAKINIINAPLMIALNLATVIPIKNGIMIPIGASDGLLIIVAELKIQ